MKIYCSGIGGIGLSAYASLQKEFGHDISGSDRSPSALTDSLEEAGISIGFFQDGSFIPEDTELFVYSEAIPISAPERLRASELGIRQMSYPEALSELSKTYTVIAVCGTHGKSSTTAMAARLLIETGRDPTVVVGTKVKELDGKNWRRGNSSLFLIEACEYRKSFHFYDPQIILMTNCDGDHFDYFKSKDLYADAFVDFLKHLPPNGKVITHLSDPDCRKVVDSSEREGIDADQYPLIDLQTPGLHMKQNSQLVLALADVLNIPTDEATAALAPFAGTWRRMEQKGVYGDDIVIIDDYAHHPREIKATIAAIRGRYPQRRIICVFQPHTHNRTIEFYDDFLESFKDVDVVLITDVYDARHDTEHEKVDIEAFTAEISQKSEVQTMYSGNLERTETQLKQHILQPGDVLLCMGAGTITDLANAFPVEAA